MLVASHDAPPWEVVGGDIAVISTSDSRRRGSRFVGIKRRAMLGEGVRGVVEPSILPGESAICWIRARGT